MLDVKKELEYRGHIVIPYQNDTFHMLDEESYSYVASQITKDNIDKALEIYFSEKVYSERKDFKEKNDKNLSDEIKSECIIISPKDAIHEINHEALDFFNDFEKENVLKILFKQIDKKKFNEEMELKLENFHSFKMWNIDFLFYLM